MVITAPASAPLSVSCIDRDTLPALGVVRANQTVLKSAERVQLCTGSVDDSVAPEVFWRTTAGIVPSGNGDEISSFPEAGSAASCMTEINWFCICTWLR